MPARLSPVLLSAAATTAAFLALATTATGATNGRIAFQFQANVKGFPQIFTIAPDGTGLKQITRVPAKDPGAENPTWSPDGARIAFDTSSGKGVNLFTVAPDGSALAELPLSVGEFNGDPAYSPDGAQISFDQDAGPKKPKVHGIFIADADGGNSRRVTTGIATKDAFDTESQWSPDGTQLAFTQVKNEREAAVFVVRIDGTGLKRLTPWSLDAASPDWSPDGTRIVFNSHYHGGGPSNLYSIRPSGGRLTALTRNRGRSANSSFRPSWSPDGTRIVFTQFTFSGRGRLGGRIDLYTINANGTGAKRLTKMPNAFPTNPDWGTAP